MKFSFNLFSSATTSTINGIKNKSPSHDNASIKLKTLRTDHDDLNKKIYQEIKSITAIQKAFTEKSISSADLQKTLENKANTAGIILSLTCRTFKVCSKDILADKQILQESNNAVHDEYQRLEKILYFSSLLEEKYNSLISLSKTYEVYEIYPFINLIDDSQMLVKELLQYKRIANLNEEPIVLYLSLLSELLNNILDNFLDNTAMRKKILSLEK